MYIDRNIFILLFPVNFAVGSILPPAGINTFMKLDFLLFLALLFSLFSSFFALILSHHPFLKFIFLFFLKAGFHSFSHPITNFFSFPFLCRCNGQQLVLCDGRRVCVRVDIVIYTDPHGFQCYFIEKIEEKGY